MPFFDKLADIFTQQNGSSSTLEEFLVSLGTPSVSIAVLDKGSIEARCFSTVGDNEETLFQAASISKPIAGTAIMRLVSQGRLCLDDRLLHVLPDELFRNLGPPEILRQITLRHLLSHTAGFRTSSYTGYPDNMPSALDTLLDRNGGRNLPEKLSAFPGQQFAYCGGNFAMLQLILERVFDKPFTKIVEEQVFEPLDMSDTSYATPAHDDETGNYARSWWTGKEPHAAPWHHHPELASGGVWTTPTDLLKLVRAVQASLDPDGDGVPETETARFLPKDLAREMLTEVEGGMALSWMVSRRKGHAFGHWGGNNPSFRCCAIGFADVAGGVEGWDLEEGCGVAVMTNGWEGHHACAKVVHAVAYLKGWPFLGTLEHAQELAVPLRDSSRKVDGRWEAWIGAWSGGWVVERGEDGGPRARFRAMEAVALVPAAIPAERGGEGTEISIDFLVGEMAVMLRLKGAEGARGVEVWNGLTFRAETLERV
ncbi:beta-lactamase [Colletotrichum navitas]|uniref:Beta-lactamase n=1 Tax=Colletotrichum navitas TaxID=681940 RepID=A0AAD8UYQ0_9PEZI|nr:beta-lactamase [Colletotrichum navitas]KAK1572698.1 beta-lactamase [Colletotrichum navitas]